ncbi:hypothetical protein [Brevibacillus daliensis]|uniref:hypothetical protein n=1 Tax=Brevibacillus daliensis TaxID=2892995 RepID=UPI001E52C93E|nr:hypothetical protein [Brevibacillus daliensis]
MINKTLRTTCLTSTSMLGATYLSGFEWLQFFSYYGSWGSLGLILSLFLITWILIKAVKYAARNQLYSLQELLAHVTGTTSTAFFGFLVAMVVIAYGGISLTAQVNLLYDYYSLPGWLLFFTLVLLVVCSTILKDSTWIPLLYFLIAGSLFFLIILSSKLTHIPLPSMLYQLNIKWIWNAVLFVGFHLVFVLTVLLPVLRNQDHVQTFLSGVVLGSIVVGIIAFLLHIQILAHWHEVYAQAEPILTIIKTEFSSGLPYFLLFMMVQTILFIGLLLKSLLIPLETDSSLAKTPLLFLFLIGLLMFMFITGQLPVLEPLLLGAITYVGFGVFILLIVKLSGQTDSSDS